MQNHRQPSTAVLIGVTLAAVTACATGSASRPLPREIHIPGTGIFPESMSAARDGSIYIGSAGRQQVYRVKPGADTAEVFIAPGTGGMNGVVGVFADDASRTVWVCSNVRAGSPAASAVPRPRNALHAFALDSGAPKGRYEFPEGGTCNDAASGADGSIYATDTAGMQVLRLPRGGSALEVWAGDGAFGPAGGVLDGIAFVGGRVIVNALATSKFFAVEVRPDGRAGRVTELQLDQPVSRPDGMRAYGMNSLISSDSRGKLMKLTIAGDQAHVEEVASGIDGVTSVAIVGKMVYGLEAQLALFNPRPGGPPLPPEKPFRLVGFELK
jgi:hypothetical protein